MVRQVSYHLFHGLSKITLYKNYNKDKKREITQGIVAFEKETQQVQRQCQAKKLDGLNEKHADNCILQTFRFLRLTSIAISNGLVLHFVRACGVRW